MKQFKKILYVLNHPGNEKPHSFAKVISLTNNNQAELCILRVIPPSPSNSYSKLLGMTPQEVEIKILADEESKLQELFALLPSTTKAKAEIKIGKSYLEIIRTVINENIDLVIKEAEQKDWLDHLIGSNDMHLLRKCPCPVWLMQPNENPNYRNIMAAVDFTTDTAEDEKNNLNDEILNIASSLAISDFASLHLVNAYDIPEAGFISIWAEKPEELERQLIESEYIQRRAKMASLLERLKNTLGSKSYNYLSPNTHLLQGKAIQELPKFAQKLPAEIVVMGTVARSGIPGLIIGNTAESILSQLKCSVIAIKPKGFVSPVK